MTSTVSDSGATPAAPTLPDLPDLPASAPTPHPDPDTAARAYELDRAHVFHSWSAQRTLDPLVLLGGQGSWLWDGDGTRYLDFSSQLVYTNLGFGHPRVVAAIQEQAGAGHDRARSTPTRPAPRPPA
ncbi:MAG: aminotransferase class III-fold pyridoxal phosphate-dependent enzyme [Kineosporiaceae bacterium]